MSLSPPMLRLIEALASQDAEDYLREQDAPGEPGNDPEENPGLPATVAAA